MEDKLVSTAIRIPETLIRKAMLRHYYEGGKLTKQALIEAALTEYAQKPFPSTPNPPTVN